NLLISNCQTNDTGSYFVIASNSAGFATSSVASLFVGNPPTILQSPLDQTNLVGSNVTFTVQANGTPPLGYTWRDTAASLSDNSRISGSTNATLSISNLNNGDAGYYDVVVTNASGSVTSSAALLTVAQPPSFTVQPAGRLALPGMSTFFTATAAATPPVTYQWQ